MSSQHDVILINMPFANLLSPSLGLGLMSAALAREGLRVKTFNFQFRFAKLIGEQAYAMIHSGMHTEHLAGEYIFSASLFPRNVSEAEITRYANEVLRGQPDTLFEDVTYSEQLIENITSIIMEAVDKVEGFLEECLETVLNCQPKVVGFTSLFHQHVASLSLAKRIKGRLPNAFIVFGGSNCEGVMGQETLRRFEFVDAVVSGEAEFIFPEIVKRVLGSQTVSGLQGVYCRDHFGVRVLQQPPASTPMVKDMDVLPFPDFDEYFEQFGRSALELEARPSLLFETSRGCWWGEKHHCTFCGLNGENMTYRAKSAARAFSEFIYLTEKHPGYTVNVVDNILDMSYFKDFIPLLAGLKHGANLFYEVKSNLKKEQLRLLREAGICALQPGIESLSDNVLRVMRKGVSAMQNIQLIKWCKELGVKVYYNLIWGFPGETPEDYSEMARLVPLITHLPPPVGGGSIRIDRFSPNFFEAEQLGFTNLLPHPAYRHVYPFGPESLFNLAYFFTADYNTPRSVSEYVRPLADEVKRWKECHAKSELFWMEKGDRLLVWDLRPAAKEALTVLKGLQKFAYMTCDQVRTERQVFESWRNVSGATADRAEVRETLDSLTGRSLMLRQGDSYLSLAYPKSVESS